MFASGIILGMAIGALIMMVVISGIAIAITRQRGDHQKDLAATNAAAREYWQFMAEETNTQTFALKQISSSLRELAKMPPTTGESN